MWKLWDQDGNAVADKIQMRLLCALASSIVGSQGAFKGQVIGAV